MAAGKGAGLLGPFDSPTFETDATINIEGGYTAASISPSGRDVVLAGAEGLLVIDLDNLRTPPRIIQHPISFKVADVQWSPFAARAEWVASTDNNKALIFNLDMKVEGREAPIQYALVGHSRVITDINFSAHHPDMLATCALDTYIKVWDLRAPGGIGTTFAPKNTHVADFRSFADHFGGATQVKWNRKNEQYIASSHDSYVKIWDLRSGAKEVTTIHAHSNKVYGIDWHRTRPDELITCSLDRQVKRWESVGMKGELRIPTATIVSQYPLLRARHTPFPNGIVAMPQHGSATLELYERPADKSGASNVTPPAHTFQNDSPERLYEFLWRSRGSCDEGYDNRDFQLVTWGVDNYLRLHKVTPDVLAKVKFAKGTPVDKKLTITRKGARYISFRDSPQHDQDARHGATTGNLTTLLLNSLPATLGPTHWVGAGGIKRATMTATRIKRAGNPRVTTNVQWMHNVKISDQGPNDALFMEIAQVGAKYQKVSFDIQGRQVTIELKGPWGEFEPVAQNTVFGDDQTITSRKQVFVRFFLSFPEAYPEGAGEPLEVKFERNMPMVTAETLDSLQDNLESIIAHHVSRNRPVLNAIVAYLVGERSLMDCVLMAQDPDMPLEGPELDAEKENEPPEVYSSSDEEGDGSDTGEFNNDLVLSSHSNAKIPLPVQTSLRFSNPGLLVTVRHPSLTGLPPGTKGILSEPIRLGRFPRTFRQLTSRDDIFERFGRIVATPDSESPTSSVVSWESSSSPSSSGSDQDSEGRFGNFLPPLPRQKGSRLHTRTSLPSSADVVKSTRKRSVVAILDAGISELIPSKRELAVEYMVFGDGPTVCLHNSEVARRHGLDDLADIWMLCRLILSNEVPLEILPQQHRREQVLVLARRALVRIKRKDSGLDLQFDEADTVTNPKLKGRVKWGHHPVVTWLIPALFDYFERLADTQMLAMLSCIFSEPAAREGVTSTVVNMKHPHLSMEAPAFSLDYFASADAAWSLFQPTLSVPPTPAHSRYATPVSEFAWRRSSRHLDTYGSHGSSNGPWGSDTLPSEPATPYSTGDTPPNLSRAPTLRSTTASHTPYSTSPEVTHTALKKASSGNFASAIANISNKFMSSSPPVKSRTDDLSTSAPTNGVTWGATTFYSSGSNEKGLGATRSKHGKRASFGQADRTIIDYISDSDSEYDDAGLPLDGASEYTAPLTSGFDSQDDGTRIRLTLKNQDQFDDEACVSAPLLDMSKEWLYRAWRNQYAEMLGCWGLVSKRAEVLKFNGLVSYFPPESLKDNGSRAGSRTGSIHLTLKERRHDNVDSGSAAQRISRASTLAIPTAAGTNAKRSPVPSPRQFSFNPEALEFQPGRTFTSLDDIPAPPADVFIPSEQYLRLSIPSPEPASESAFLDGATESKISPYPQLRPRPSVSRATSNISGTASVRLQEPTSSPKKEKGEPIYSCSICWIRVSGRFYLCPTCGHLAHFECMNDELGIEEGDCIVGCGCGCGLEDEREQSGIEDYIERVRAWEERGGWLPEVEFDEEASTQAVKASSLRVGQYEERNKKRDERARNKTRQEHKKPEAKTSMERGKGKKKARVTGKSYY